MAHAKVCVPLGYEFRLLLREEREIFEEQELDDSCSHLRTDNEFVFMLFFKFIMCLKYTPYTEKHCSTSGM